MSFFQLKKSKIYFVAWISKAAKTENLFGRLDCEQLKKVFPSSGRFLLLAVHWLSGSWLLMFFYEFSEMSRNFLENIRKYIQIR